MKKFMILAPTNNDIWNWLKAVLNDVRIIRLIDNRIIKLKYVSKSQKIGLYKIIDF